MTTTINNAIILVPENTIDPAAGLNLSLNTIDAIVQVLVVSVGLNTPPTGVEGNRYIVGTAPTGLWVGQANKLARFLNGAWQFFDVRTVLNATDGFLYVRSGSTWAATGTPFTGGTLTSAINEAPLVTLASASSVSIGAAASNTILISGAVTITSLGTIAAGAKRILVFQGTPIITHNATSLILPTSANITAAAGDAAEFVSLGSGNWRCTNYQRLNGQSLVDNGSVTSVAATVPTGFAVSGSPITTAGTIAITFAAGYSLPTIVNQTNWSTAFGWGDHALAGYAVGPSSAVNNNVALFDGTTGKLLKDGGTLGTAAFANTGAFATAAQGALADTAIQSTEKGAANGVATLNSSGLIPSGQLPGFVDDVIDFPNFASLPLTGETGKIYITVDDNRQYRWSGSIYVELVASPGTTDDVTEGATNLYFTASRVRDTLLTGISFVSALAVTAADSILVAIGKLQAQITALTSSKQDVLVSGTSLKTINSVSLLGAGDVSVQPYDADTAKTDVAQTWSAMQIFGTAIGETTHDVATDNVDLSLASVYTKTISGATTFTVSNVPAFGIVSAFILDLTNGGSAVVTWWSGVEWQNGSAPSLTVSGRDVLGFFTHSGGAEWTGIVLARDAK